MHTGVMPYMNGENNLPALIHSFYHVGPREQTHVISLGSNSPDPLSNLTGLLE